MGNGKSAAAHRHGRRLCDHAELATDRWRRCGELLSGTMRNPNPNPNPNANPNPNQVLLSGTMRGFRERCIPSLRENIVQANTNPNPT